MDTFNSKKIENIKKIEKIEKIENTITLKEKEKEREISELNWKPAQGGATLDSVGFWVHVIVFALLIYLGLLLKKNY